MRYFILFSFFSTCLIMSTSWVFRSPVQADWEPQTDITSEMQGAINEAISLGRQIYEKDIAAGLASEVLSKLENIKLENTENGPLLNGIPFKGIITDEIQDGWRVLYIGELNGDYKALYTLDIVNGEYVDNSLKAYPDGKELSQLQQGMYAARVAATMAKNLEPCPTPYTTVILPRYDNTKLSNYYVYFLASPTEELVIHAGKHFRIEIDANSMEIKKVKAFTETCLDIPITRAYSGDFFSLNMTHLLADTPEETHVYQSILYEIPFVVATVNNDKLWKVDGDQITQIDGTSN